MPIIVRRQFSRLAQRLSLLAVSLLSFLTLPYDLWAQRKTTGKAPVPSSRVTEREAIRALDDQLEILIKKLSEDRRFDQRTKEELQDLDSIVNEYLGGNPQMSAKISCMPAPNQTQQQ